MSPTADIPECDIALIRINAYIVARVRPAYEAKG